MQRLHAEVYEEQQKRLLRQQLGPSSLDDSKSRLRKQRGASGNKRRELQDRKDPFSRENKGVRERENRDKEEHSKNGKRAKEDKVKLALEAKARIYDKLQRQSMQLESDDDLRKGASACEEVLVDFGRKREKRAVIPSSDSDSQHDNVYSDIEDEFGRQRRVLRSSEDYYLARKRKADEALEHSNAKMRMTTCEESQRDYEGQQQSAREFVNAVRQEVQQTSINDNENLSGRQGGVRSQWDEKVLRGEERSHLNNIHQETLRAREQHHHHHLHDSARNDDVKQNTEILETASKKPLSAVERRREMIRQKQSEFRKRELANTAR